MSHFINTHQPITKKRLFQIKSKKVIQPSYDSIFNNISCDQRCSTGQQKRIKQSLNKMCNKYMQSKNNKLREKQKKLLFSDNKVQLLADFGKLKKRWKKNCEQVYFQNRCHRKITTQVQKFMQQCKQSGINMIQILKQVPKNVQITKKYNKNTVLSYSNLHEAYQIYQDKQKYREWLDQTYNRSEKSQNLRRIKKILKQNTNPTNKQDLSKFGITKLKTTTSFYNRKSEMTTFDLRSVHIGTQWTEVKKDYTKSIAHKLIKTQPNQ